MNLYVYRDHCTLAGLVVRQRDLDDFGPDSADFFLWGIGTREDLIRQALERLTRREDYRYNFAWRCALNVLCALHGPRVEYDEARRAYRVVSERDVE